MEKVMNDLKKKACTFLEEFGRKSGMSANDWALANEVTGTIKNIDKILMHQGGGMSRDGMWEARGSYDGNGGSGSYANQGQHWVQGHYSRDGYSQDGYSMHGDRNMKELERMMHEARSSHEKEAIRNCMNAMRKG